MARSAVLYRLFALLWPVYIKNYVACVAADEHHCNEKTCYPKLFYINRCQRGVKVLSKEQFIYLTTNGWKSGRRHKIEIWFVEHYGKYYVMSEGRERAHWVQNIIHDPKISFRTDLRSFTGTGRVVDKGPIAVEVKKLMKSKYGWDSGLIVELSPNRTTG